MIQFVSTEQAEASWAVAGLLNLAVVSSKIKEIRAQHGTIPNTAAAQFSAPHLATSCAADI